MFFSSAELQAAIQHHRVIPGVKFVVDDLEDLGITPRAERKEPIPAMKGFAHAAHARGYQPILIPGRDLMLVSGAMCSQQRGHTISQSYLRCGLPAAAAAYAPIYVIQAAAVETNLTALRQLVQEAAAQARKANPKVTIFATLSVSPNGLRSSSRGRPGCRGDPPVCPGVRGEQHQAERLAHDRLLDRARRGLTGVALEVPRLIPTSTSRSDIGPAPLRLRSSWPAS